MSEEKSRRFGIVALAGRPNAGKSTLLNTLVGEKLAIVSPKPQSTRTPVLGLLTENDCQLLFVDPPGLLDPSGIMQESMVYSAEQVAREAHALLLLHPITEGPPPALEALLPTLRPESRPLAIIFTKADLLANAANKFEAATSFIVSAKTGEGISEVVEWCRSHAPMGDFRYDADDIGTQPVRFFAEEFVRESVYEILEQELPYAAAALVDEYREDPKPVYIRVTLYVERESQKGMVIGKGGGTIKAIGAAARKKIEEFLGDRVYLDLRVKVLAKWRKSPKMLRMFGMTPPQEKGKRQQ